MANATDGGLNMGFRLVVTSGQDADRSIVLDEGVTTVGRGPAADVRLPDLSVSRQHCILEVRGPRLLIADAGSSSGTFVNSSRIDGGIELKPGDEIRVGDTVLTVSHSADSQKTIPPGPGGSSASGRLPDLAGRTIHDYELVRLLGEGRTGVVYLARDVRKERDVAVRILKPEVTGSPEGMARFVRAMKTMHGVRHENLVRIWNAGRTGDLVWVSMEYVDGENMAQVIDSIGTAGMLDWEYAFRVAVHTARGLEAAAEHRIVHRNIRPESILMRTSDQVVKLGDTMLARALEGTMAEQITRPGELIGDLTWLAPEQTTGSADIDIRSDIYALGATCYALLTGRPPFTAGTFPELLQKIRTEPPEPPRNFQLSINDLFSGCVMKMLEKRPEDRYETPAALLKDLDRVGTFAGVSV